MFKIIFLFILLVPSLSYSKLLDKVVGGINENIYTLSELRRIKNTISIRKEISPFIYTKDSYQESEILTLLQRNFVIKDKLSELGFVISDDAVESRINETERSLGLNRTELLQFLSTKNITFNEYFELIRQAMQYSVFQRRIIAPLITITDQELKNYYYKNNSNNKVLRFKYKVVDFSLPSSSIITSEDEYNLPNVLQKYQKTGVIPEMYKDIDTMDLGNISDEDIPKELSNLLKQTDEKSFSKPYKKDGTTHSFYVVEKDLVESTEFIKQKNMIYNQIFMERSESVSNNWFNREILNYYIVNNLWFMLHKGTKGE